MTKRKTEAYPPEIYEKIDGFRLFDDTFMSKVFDGQVDAAALLLRVILGDPAIIVLSVRTQVEIKNLQGRSVRLDIRAKDAKGDIFVVEVQRAGAGAGRKRARNISSMLDANALRPNDDVERLPETYVVFITETDVLGGGKPIYHIERMIEETGERFGDMEHIVYVNGEKTGRTELGRLMHDFRCTRANDMYYKVLADRVRYFKETQSGREDMCAIMEEYAAERTIEDAKRAIVKGFRGGLTKEMAKTMYPKLKKSEIEALYQEAKKPARGRKIATR